MKTATFVLTLLLVPAAFAQPDNGGYRGPEPSHPPVPLVPSDFGFSQHHSSTVAEGYLRGWAAWRHAQGNFLINRSQAAVLAEQARSLDLSNDQQRIAFRDWKQVLRDGRIETKRRQNEAERAAKYRAAYELGPERLDRSTGKIDWPEALRAARYKALRERLDVLFRKQSGYYGPTTNSSSEIEREAQRLIRDCARNRSEVPQTEYLAAQKFLRGLKYESLFRSQVL